jgi:hypothetical protein
LDGVGGDKDAIKDWVELFSIKGSARDQGLDPGAGVSPGWPTECHKVIQTRLQSKIMMMMVMGQVLGRKRQLQFDCQSKSFQITQPWQLPAS